MPENERILLSQKRSDTLMKFNDYIKKVNPSSPDDIRKVNFISEVLAELSINENVYEKALKSSDDKILQLHLVYATDSCVNNNYFDIGLLAMEEDTDIQVVFNC